MKYLDDNGIPIVPSRDQPRCEIHGTVMGMGDNATERCAACWQIFAANCARCIYLDELRSRMTGSKCDDCRFSEVHLDYGPSSERFSTRLIRYNPRTDGVAYPKRDGYSPWIFGARRP